MAIARRMLVSPETTPYYHLISRCVRRGFLCGFDPYSKNDYEHRRQWIVDRLAHLAALFAIDILAYAVMSNHYHLVVGLRPERAHAWSDDEVIDRWTKLYGPPPLLRLFQQGLISEEQEPIARQMIEVRRQRLASVSWFMKCLNEHIARRANAEDHCTGAFWEGRFKSRALLNERALLSCMAYVDLNPVRAGMASTPESSDYTSIQARLRRQAGIKLMPLRGEVPEGSTSDSIPVSLADYLSLVDLSGRYRSSRHHSFIDDALPPILDRLGLDQRTWAQAVQIHRSPFYMLGTADEVRKAARRLARRWFRGVRAMGVFEKN